MPVGPLTCRDIPKMADLNLPHVLSTLIMEKRGLILVVGAVATHYLGRRLVVAFDRLMMRLPVVKGIYGAARQLLDTDLSKRWRRGMSYNQFQQNVLMQGDPLLTRNPYADYMLFQRAERFSVAELRSWMESVFEVDLRLKSSATAPRLVMEKLLLDMCLGSRRKQSRATGRIGA